jgi:hypothetical protein
MSQIKMDSNIPASITTQPVENTSNTTKSTKVVSGDGPRPHLCACERGCSKFINCALCLPKDVQRKVDCPTKCSDISDFRVYYCTSDDDGWCCGIMCFPITLVLKLVREVPCVSYNICRNKCEGTKEIDYLP